MSTKGSDFIDVQNGSGGGPVGPKILGSIFIPFGMGAVFNSGDGRFWQLRLAQNPDGTLFIGGDAKPTIELIEVAP